MAAAALGQVGSRSRAEGLGNPAGRHTSGGTVSARPVRRGAAPPVLGFRGGTPRRSGPVERSARLSWGLVVGCCHGGNWWEGDPNRRYELENGQRPVMGEV